MSTSTEVQQDTRFFGHPRGLANLFGVEMWERFSYYGMLGILPIYLYYRVEQGGLGLAQESALGIVGAYGGLVYLSAVIGAWVADRLLGSERTLFYSAVLIMIGHLSLALLPGLAGIGVGLVCVAVGSGGLKSNATAIVGTLYAEGDERRDAGFTIFYMGVNLGGFVGPLLTGLAQTQVGFHLGFGLAAIGMALGLTQYTFGRKNLGDKAKEVPNPLPASQRVLAIGAAVVLVAAVVALVVTGVVNPGNLADVVVWVVGVISVVYFLVILTSGKITGVERSRVFSFIPMFIASAVFFSLYQQQFTVVAAYTDQRLNRNLFGWEMPVSWVNSINPVFIIVFAPILAALWTKLGERQPSTPMKFVLGTVLMGAAFLLFLPMVGSGKNASPILAMVGILFVFTIAELCLSPVGLSLSTKLAPAAFRTQMVALNFLSISFGTAMSGKLAEYYSVDDEAPYFSTVGLVAIGVGVLLFLGIPFIRKLMKGVH
ncbi:proton-dependent oligopeptide transporter POT family [Amycolatopsis mediterranei S699]|uniref:Proton-dependent oligopeptide transporter, POT family n=2 Tax=Amycolatopsis mediterranei TaxID=33910 RepID=A0A0H3DLD2_AMYMU|nr:peptide MFS transporter [Amycolatopsis mediterranei]ADJ50514.1 proton-dependent oligopeptide transporter, POT family [Amycolatopsis mediterranei U32]AEK47519.1 proton-dependent oligopeptide transporter POT family protein [Amycolatopsis mediterranei S699]AFO82220.1 proton-dependent oligopeptide transporter POT family [Amycolatopsis mediterranei S699]AGT89349.1 proton-dependent oligopeptide transporter POT family [Amycolatopsis mediterranei RB]KDO09528.1 major facilitator transporter [Amycola